MGKTSDPEMATPKRVRTSRPKHCDTSLSREWRINMAIKKIERFKTSDRKTQSCALKALCRMCLNKRKRFALKLVL